MWSSLLAVGLGVCGADGPAVAAEVAPAVKLEAAGKPIDVEIGHAAPAYVDIDGDGLKDLLVGQFGGGKLRIYKNVGSNSRPRFGEFAFLQAGGSDATVPYG